MARPDAAPPAALRRRLGPFSATMVVVGGIIGSGIYFTPAEVARALPNGQSILLVWALGGVVALAGALTYAELGAMMPDAGGAYVYLREGFGGLSAFLYAWMSVGLIATGALAAVAMGFANALGRLVDLGPVGGPLPVAAAAIVALTLTNYLGVRPGAVVTNVLTVTKVAVLVALIGVGLLSMAAGNTPPTPYAMPRAPAPPSLPLAQFAAAFPPVLFTIGGWQQMNMVAGEIRDPARTIPRALLAGILIVIACYLGANAVYLYALFGRDWLAVSKAVAADAAGQLFGPAGAGLIGVGVMLSILGFVNVTILSNSRIVYAVAEDGAFLRAAAKVHPRFGSPHVAVAILGAWALVLLAATGGELGTLLGGVVFADWIFFGLGGASVFALRRKRPDAERPYRALGYPLLPALFVVAAAVGILSAIVSQPRMSALGAALLAAGAAVYAARARWGKG